MTTFGYKVVTAIGKQIKGSIEAENLEKARQELKKKEYTVIELKEQGFLSKDLNIEIGGNVKARDLSVMCRQFVSMTRAGVTIIAALQLLSEQTENKKLTKALKEVRISVEKGETLAESLGKHPKVFPGLMVNMVSAGEASGNLETAMERMAEHFERSSKTQALVKKAMIYPVAVLVIAMIVSVVMLVKVIPTYDNMFSQMNTELPWITKMYVAMSDFLIGYWFLLIPCLALVFFGIAKYAKTNSGKHLFGKIALKLPAFKGLIVKSASSLMARTLGTLMASGVPLMEAVGIVADLMGNIWFKEALLETKEAIAIGMPLSRPLEESGLFPPMVYHMISIGEESGSTESMLDKVADYFDEEVEMSVQSLMAVMEPLIVVVLAVVVGGLLAACMAPMLTMYDALSGI